MPSGHCARSMPSGSMSFPNSRATSWSFPPLKYLLENSRHMKPSSEPLTGCQGSKHVSGRVEPKKVWISNTARAAAWNSGIPKPVMTTDCLAAAALPLGRLSAITCLSHRCLLDVKRFTTHWRLFKMGGNWHRNKKPWTVTTTSSRAVPDNAEAEDLYTSSRMDCPPLCNISAFCCNI